jgi:short-subunit dehydrogenase
MTMKGTALITGAASGLGLAFCERLAALSYDLWMVDKNAELLAEARTRLQALFPATIRADVVDLSRTEELDNLRQNVLARDALAMLVNNAGFGADAPFLNLKPETLAAMIAVHDIAMATLCHAALPAMIRRRQGFIINVSSLQGLDAPENGHPLYGATKAFINHFSLALRPCCESA